MMEGNPAKLGLHAILLALLKPAVKANAAKRLGLDVALTAHDAATTLHRRAQQVDIVAAGALLYIATYATALFLHLCRQKPSLLRPLIERAVLLPVLLSPDGPGNEPARARLRELGFGAHLNKIEGRPFANGFALPALLCQLQRTLHLVASGSAESWLRESDSEYYAKDLWDRSERQKLERAAGGKLSDLPCEEVSNLRRSRSAQFGRNAEVSGEVACKLKGWHLKCHRLLAAWRLAPAPPTTPASAVATKPTSGSQQSTR